MNDLLKVAIAISLLALASLKALDHDEYIPSGWGSYYDGRLIERFDTYSECNYINDGHGTCSPITEDK